MILCWITTDSEMIFEMKVFFTFYFKGIVTVSLLNAIHKNLILINEKSIRQDWLNLLLC